eukprot:comp21050_c0_seq3/m.44271 comp21050_c0_seq3/g.44271  ORF comp21050_c0_seq3/g.44271 comp21050_c0_seq3/m.44271 type:complete len:213 (-) comp21050_c0_seq3:46-684(-)
MLAPGAPRLTLSNPLPPPPSLAAAAAARLLLLERPMWPVDAASSDVAEPKCPLTVELRSRRCDPRSGDDGDSVLPNTGLVDSRISRRLLPTPLDDRLSKLPVLRSPLLDVPAAAAAAAAASTSRSSGPGYVYDIRKDTAVTGTLYGAVKVVRESDTIKNVMEFEVIQIKSALKKENTSLARAADGDGTIAFGPDDASMDGALTGRSLALSMK